MIKLRRKNEEGSALVMALIMLTMLSLFLSALLTFSETSFRSTLAVRDQRKNAYSAEGAAHVAIQKIRNNPGLLRGLPSDPFSCLPDFTANGVHLKVKCEPTATLAASTANSPDNAILTLSTDNAAEGSGYTNSFKPNLQIGGPVWINSNIDPSNSATEVHFGDVTAFKNSTTTCPGMTVDPGYTANCKKTPIAPKSDPGYPKRDDAPDLTTLAGRTPATIPPGCVSSGADKDLMRLSPGFYNNADALNAALNVNCAAVWFQPGVYYFNFTGSTTPGNVDLVFPSNRLVLGGEYIGWSSVSDTFTQATDVAGYKRRCKTDQDGVGPGVQFIFGRYSHVTFNSDSEIELCAKRETDKQHIAWYGVPGNITATQAAPLPVNPGNSTASGSPAFANKNNAHNILESPTVLTSDLVVNNPSSDTTRTINLNSFNFGTNLTGAKIDKVELRIRHRETGTVDTLALAAKYSDGTTGATFANGNCATPTTFLCKSSSFTDQTFNITSAFNTVAKLTGSSIDFTGTIKKNQTGSVLLDGVQLIITYTPAAYESQSQNYDFINSPANKKATVNIHGTVYMPKAFLQFEVGNCCSFGVDRGIIANRLDIAYWPQGDGYGVQLFGLAPQGIKLTVCKFDDAACSDPLLTSTVAFDFQPTPGPLSTLKWLVFR